MIRGLTQEAGQRALYPPCTRSSPRLSCPPARQLVPRNHIPVHFSAYPPVRPSLALLVHRVADASLSTANAKQPRTERSPRQALLRILGNGLSALIHIYQMPIPLPVKRRQAGRGHLSCSHLASSHDFHSTDAVAILTSLYMNIAMAAGAG